MSKDERETIELLDIPTEILAHLLDFLDRSYRFPASQSCKRLSSIILHHVGYKRISVKSRSDCSRLSGSPLLINTEIYFGDFIEATDSDLSLISGVRRLFLRTNHGITDRGLHRATGVQSLTLQDCKRITDFGIGPLVKNLKTICLIDVGYYQLTLLFLTGIPSISLPSSKILTDDILHKLAGVHTIDLSGCKRISDKGISSLAGVHKIYLCSTNVTDKGISALAGVHTIDISWCLGVTGSCMKDISDAYEVKLSYTSASDYWIDQLTGVKVLQLQNCNITNKCLIALAQRGVTVCR